MNAHQPMKAAGRAGLDLGGRPHRVPGGLARRIVRRVPRGTSEANTVVPGDPAREARSARGTLAAEPVFGRTLADLRADLPLGIIAALVAAVAVLLVGAEPALAQQGGGGDSINSAITSLNQWLATIVVSLGGTALLICVIVWLFSGSDSKRREGAVRWMGSIVVAIFVGLSVPAIIAVIQGFAGGGGG